MSQNQKSSDGLIDTVDIMTNEFVLPQVSDLWKLVEQSHHKRKEEQSKPTQVKVVGTRQDGRKNKGQVTVPQERVVHALPSIDPTINTLNNLESQVPLPELLKIITDDGTIDIAEFVTDFTTISSRDGHKLPMMEAGIDKVDNSGSISRDAPEMIQPEQHVSGSGHGHGPIEVKLPPPQASDLWKLVEESHRKYKENQSYAVRVVKPRQESRDQRPQVSAPQERVIQFPLEQKLVQNDLESEPVPELLEIMAVLRQYQSVVFRQKKEIDALHEEIYRLKQNIGWTN